LCSRREQTRWSEERQGMTRNEEYNVNCILLHSTLHLPAINGSDNNQRCRRLSDSDDVF